jgi:hypothetical protein
MSFNITRDANKKPVFKTITRLNNNALLNQLVDSKPAGSDTIALNSLTVGSVNVTSTTVTQLEPVTAITAGTTTASKAIVLDSSKDLNGINKLYCSQIYINDVLLNPSIFSGGAVSVSSNDSSRAELINVTPGTASAGKAIIAGSDSKATGINLLSTESIENNELLVNRKNNNVVIGPTMGLLQNSRYNAADLIAVFTTSTSVATSNSTSDILWQVWNPILELHFASFNDNTVKTSPDAINWTTSYTNTSGCRNITYAQGRTIATAGAGVLWTTNGTQWYGNSNIAAYNIGCVAYSSDLNMYVAGGVNGQFLYSYDLSTWYTGESPNANYLDVKWCRNRFIACTDNQTNGLYFSLDGIKWTGNTHTSQSQGNIKCIGYSRHLNTIVIPTGANSGRSNRVGFYSQDGGVTFRPYYINGGGDVEFYRVEWFPEIGLFMGVTISYRCLGFSPDGINWKVIQHSTTGTYCAVTYSPKYKYFIAKLSTSTSCLQYANNLFNRPTKSNFWTFDGNSIGFNSSSNAMINIGSDNDKLVRFSNISKTNPFEINVSGGVTTFMADEINIMCTNLTFPGGQPINTGALYKVSLLSSKFIKNTLSGMLRTDATTVGGTGWTGTVSSDFAENTIGSAVANKFLLTDENDAVSGLTSIGVNSVKMDNYTLTNSNNTNEVDLGKKSLQKPVSFMTSLSLNTSLSTAVPAYNGGPLITDELWYISQLDLLFYVQSSNIYVRQQANTGITAAVSLAKSTLFSGASSLTINDVVYFKETGMMYFCTNAGIFKGRSIFSLCKVNMMSSISENSETIAYSPVLDIYVACSTTSTMISKNGIDFKKIPDARYTDGLLFVRWAPNWNLFIGVARTSTTTRAQFVWSEDGQMWDHLEYTDNLGVKGQTITSLVFCSKLGIALASYTSGIYYSYDGRSWNFCSLPTVIRQITWHPELEIFTCPNTSTSTALLSYSYDGLNWIQLKAPTTIPSATYGSFTKRWAYIDKLGALITTSTSTTAGLAYLQICNTITPNSCAVEDSNNFSVDIVNNRVGLAVSSPQFSLHLGEDLAFKPTSSAWTTSSDERLKEEIAEADLDECVRIVSEIDPKIYTWKSDNKKQLGWIAQEVEPVLPKSVSTKEMYGLTDCKTLNNDQLIACMYGTVQKLLKEDAELEEHFE